MKNWIFTIVFALILFGIGFGLSNIHPTPESDSLTIVRSKPLKQPILLPDTLTVTVKNTTVNKELYADLLAMPDAPKGKLYCPADFGVTYHLTFKRGYRVILQADADAGGCQFIRLSNGKVVWSAGKPGEPFWSLLGQTLVLTNKQLREVLDE